MFPGDFAGAGRETQNPGGNCEEKNISRKYLKSLQIQQGIADQRKDENRS